MSTSQMSAEDLVWLLNVQMLLTVRNVLIKWQWFATTFEKLQKCPQTRNIWIHAEGGFETYIMPVQMVSVVSAGWM